MKNDVYTQVAQNCSAFYPRFDMFKSCPEAGAPTCNNCKNFKSGECSKDLFDAIKTNLF